MIKNGINYFLEFFARTDVFSYTLLWLIVLLVFGTLAQVDLGLYLAQERYFSSYIFWLADLVPLPGGYATMTVIFFSLFSKLILQKWEMKDLGTIIIHVGAITLLFGGFLTAFFSSEGNMVIFEGEESNYVSDYHDVEVAITLDEREVVFGEEYLKESQVLSSSRLPFEVKIEKYCRNCQLISREEPLADDRLRPMTKMFELKSAPLFKEDEANYSGLVFEVIGTKESDGVYTIFESMPVLQYIEAEGKKYLIDIRQKRTYLPFSIKLNDFIKESYPGTNKAKSYSSKIELRDKDINWRGLIEMNEPLRYKGYTFFQASFIDVEGKQATVLAVVKNIGRMFPYISSIIMCVGLLIHLFQRIPLLIRKKRV